MEKEREYLNEVLITLKTKVEGAITSHKESLRHELNHEMMKHVTHAEIQIELAAQRYIKDYKLEIEKLETAKRLDHDYMASTYERQRKSLKKMLEHRLNSTTNLWLKQIKFCLANME